MMNKEKNFASAIIYIHNAENRIEDFLRTIIDIMQDNFEHSEIICVNDSSDDNSLVKIKEVSSKATTTSISIVNMNYFHGLELSMNAGIDLAIGDFVFEFDNTVLDFDKNEVMKIYRKSLEGYDIVSASPDKKERFSSSLFYKVLNRFTNISYKMSTENFRVLSRRVINRITSMNKMVPYRKVIYANSGLRMCNLKYTVLKSYTRKDSDKKEQRYRSGLAIDSFILFTEMGYKFSIAMTFAVMLITIFMLMYTIIIYMTSSPISGWTTTILFLSIAFFGLFGVLTIIVKYLQLLVNLVFKRKHYSFESIEKLTK